jgi:hypothetical protein
MSTIRDPNVKEVIAKESLHYKPKETVSLEQEAKNVKALENLIEVRLFTAFKIRCYSSQKITLVMFLLFSFADRSFCLSQVWPPRGRVGLHSAHIDKENSLAVLGPQAIQKRVAGKI